MPTTNFVCGECGKSRPTLGRVNDTCNQCWAANLPRRDVQLGQRFGRLLVTQLRPFMLLCDCGEVVTDRKPYHVTHGKLKSCGCAYRKPTDMPASTARWSSIEALNPGEKSIYQRFRVRCVRCDGSLVVCYASARGKRDKPNGCKLCVMAKSEEARLTRAAWIADRAARKAVADAC